MQLKMNEECTTLPRLNEESRALDEKAVDVAKRFHGAESELIDLLQKIDDKKVFLRLDCTSLFDYAVKRLKLSEANASNFIAIARKSKTVPELKLAIAAGEITVSKARKITPVLTAANQSHWIELAKTLPKPKLEKEVARVMPQTLVQEKAKYVSESRVSLNVGLEERIVKNIRRAQDIVSQKARGSANLEKTIDEVFKFFLERQDPVEKAKRNVQPKSGKAKASPDLKVDLKNANDALASVPGTHNMPKKQAGKNPRYIVAKTKHQVNLRDEGQCVHKDANGNRCENKRWLEIHHQLPLMYGGSNDVGNLRTLCSAHHKMRHTVSF